MIFNIIGVVGVFLVGITLPKISTKEFEAEIAFVFSIGLSMLSIGLFF